MQTNPEVDALVVGGGFGGVYCWYELKKNGFNTVKYEAGDDLGGTWRWNCYPGAGVESEIPEYQLSIPETYKDWTWSTNYPDYAELRAYFDHCDKVLNEGRWYIKTADSRTAKAKYFIVAAGFAAKRYVPEEFTGFILLAGS
ncbi:hypothetical protein OIDMADRAFT_48616 [Oidiodendron maius Zn]|uniref:FAD/NAD(P)-binding domain-containing protein n=1 Tax=Oidiodendron maius (strain Zn) TaxID=913774 RepID=A0A0C3E351_OIDMZ|nr:hypothetical protein OIDMADRAFT_48616 [Oidiodendron maius Zn]